MKNFVQPGVNLTLTSPAAVKSGDVLVLGAIVGVVAGDAEEGDAVDVVTQGVFDLPKVGADAFEVGDVAYWDEANALVTSTATDNTKLGVAVAVAAASSSSVEVRLSGF